MPVHLGVSTPPELIDADLADGLRRSAARTRVTRRPDPTMLAELRRGGLLGLAVPVEHGGAGGDAVAVNDAVERVARLNPSIAIVLFQHYAVTARLVEWGDERQRTELLPRFASGEVLAASSWSEPGAGAAKKRLGTLARRDDDGGWSLEGRKSFTTSAGIADVYLVLAQAADAAESADPDAPEPAYGGVGQTFFLVGADNPGLLPLTDLDLAGMTGSATGFVELTGARVPESARLGPVGRAAEIIAGVRESGASLGAVSLGIASALVDIADEHMRRRDAGDRVARHRVSELVTQVEAARALVDRAGRRDSPDPGSTTLHSKLFASVVAEQIGSEVSRMTGSTGYVADHELNMMVDDARAVALMGPTNDLCRELVIASWLR